MQNVSNFIESFHDSSLCLTLSISFSGTFLTILGPPQLWWFTWQFLNVWEISFSTSVIQWTCFNQANGTSLTLHSSMNSTDKKSKYLWWYNQKAIHLLNIWATVPHQNCLSWVPNVACCLDRSSQLFTWKWSLLLVLHKNLHPRSENLHLQDVCQAWSQSFKASLQEGYLYPLSGSIQKLLDIGNAIHRKQ